MYDGKDTIVIFDKLAYEDLLPVHWRATPQLVDDVTAQHYAERNIRVLQSCDALEEHGQLDKSDDESPHSADLRRLDFKLNLLLDIAGQLVAASQPRPKPSSIRLNAMGASFTYDQVLKEGEYGVLEVVLRDIVVQPLHLPAQVVSGPDTSKMRVRFLSLGETVADHIEKLVFRRHRRKIAGARGIRRV